MATGVNGVNFLAVVKLVESHYKFDLENATTQDPKETEEIVQVSISPTFY